MAMLGVLGGRTSLRFRERNGHKNRMRPLCTSSLSNDAALAEWIAMEREATHNLAEIARGKTPEYRPAAKFVAKIIPDMPRDQAHWDMRAEQALRLPAKEGRRHFLTRDTIPPGEAGYLYLQAKLLAAAARSLPFETAIHRWDELDLAGPLKLRIDRLDESGIHLDVDVASRADPGTWEERAGALMMRGLMAAFSSEVALKAILMTRCHRAKKIRDLWELYSDLPEDSRARLEADYTDIGNVLRGLERSSTNPGTFRTLQASRRQSSAAYTTRESTIWKRQRE